MNQVFIKLTGVLRLDYRGILLVLFKKNSFIVSNGENTFFVSKLNKKRSRFLFNPPLDVVFSRPCEEEKVKKKFRGVLWGIISVF